MNATSAMGMLESPNSYEKLRHHCLRIAGYCPEMAPKMCIKQILGHVIDRWRDRHPRSPLDAFVYPLAQFADAHAAMDQENEALRKRLLEVYSLRINPPLMFMEGPAPVPPDTRTYWRRVWDALRSYR